MKWKRSVTLSKTWNCEVKSMNSVFSFGLYREGLKKVKLVGIIAAILCVVITALIPIVSMIEGARRVPNITGNINVETVEIGNLAVPLLLILAFSPLFIYMMFSFLNKRSESDFYHSIPYRRECVYVSFTAAAITWIWGIILVTLAVAGILWGINPYAVFAVGDLFRLGFAYILSTAFIAGLMLVAMMLTGTIATNLSIFALLACFVRVLGALIVMCLEELVPIYDISYSPAAFLEIDFSLPLGLLGATINTRTAIKVFSNTPVFIYTGVCAVLLIAAGCLLYRFRKSEMAGMSAPNRMLQHIFRCAFTLPFVLVLATEILMGAEGAVILVTVIGVLLVYYLYELITTKRIKRLLSATPYLGVLAVAGGIFIGSILLVSNGILNQKLPADKIDGIANYSTDYDYAYADYDAIMTAGITIRDDRAAEIVADALKDSQEAVRKGTFYLSQIYDKEPTNTTYVHRNVEIRLKSGKTIGRTIRLTLEQSRELDQCFLNSPEYSEAVLKLPEDKEITSLYVDSVLLERVSLSSEFEKQLWETFRNEYETLSDEEKYSVLYGEKYSGITLHVQGQHNYMYYNLPIPITENTPKTLNLFLQEVSRYLDQLSHAQKLLRSMADSDWWKTTQIVRVELRFDMYGTGDDLRSFTVSAYNYHDSGDDHSGVEAISKFLSGLTGQSQSDEGPGMMLTVSTYVNNYQNGQEIYGDYAAGTNRTYFSRLTVNQYETLLKRLEQYQDTYD